jgi:hypothetical protein
LLNISYCFSLSLSLSLYTQHLDTWETPVWSPRITIMLVSISSSNQKTHAVPASKQDLHSQQKTIPKTLMY